jgi:ribonuclease G
VSRVLALSVAPGEVRGVLLEDGMGVELRLERAAKPSLVGAVFWGRIARVVPSLPGAFIDLGRARPAFLPGERLPGDKALVEGAGLLVKITKDGFEDKAPEVTAAPDFPGSFAVWTPSRPGIAVSRRIAPAERARLLALLGSLVGAGEGAVLRSHAAGVEAEVIAADLDRLRRDHIALLAAAAAATAPRRLDPVEDAITRIAAGIGPEIDRIVLDDRASLAPLRARVVRPERVELDAAPDFAERHGLAEAFEQALAASLPLDGGGDITIESTLAFTAIDVNLGQAAGRRGRAAEAILAVNLAAAAAVARQLRLRNIGGAVVIDFITMAAREHRRMVEAALAQVAAVDPVPTECHGWTRLGHFELTRKRGTASIPDLMLAPGGGRRVKSAVTVALEVVRALGTGSFRPGPVEIRVSAEIARELAGDLASDFDGAAACAGRKAVIVIEAGRDPETFDIGAA